ncbi:MAG: type VI secretion system tube protein Hcp [Planctomycetes bacterium]|nr:type VI secretion system tube protein Hcp [Planctomycetota bacterium]
MALTAYLTLQLGSGKVKGSSRFKNREDQILVIGMSHEIVNDRDADGVPQKGRKHRPLVIQKDIDRSSPILWQAFRDNVTFDFGFLEFTRFPPGGGPQEIHATINFSKARITSIRGVMPNARVPENEPIPEYEEVTFCYDSIDWRWLGKDVDDTDSDASEQGCDFSAYSPSWAEQLDARIEKSLTENAGKAGLAAVAALKAAMADAIKENEQGKD